MQTLKQALELARTGKSKSLARAANYLSGLPAGGWGETEQARRQIENELPLRCDRSYTVSEFIEAAYELDHADRYQPKLGAEDGNPAAIAAAQAESRRRGGELVTLEVTADTHAATAARLRLECRTYCDATFNGPDWTIELVAS